MATQAYFDPEPGFETEIFQSQRFGKLRLVTGEVICLGMAARILFLLKNGHSSSCIPCHILTEFDVEKDIETIRAVVEKDFEVFAQDLSPGEYVVPIAPPILGLGYHDGHILPAGIAYECINMRDHGVLFVMRYAKVQWGLTIPETAVTTLINEWNMSVTRAGEAGGVVPADARPQREGRLLTHMALQPHLDSERRNLLFEHPPPQYEPRPVYRNNSGQEVCLRHPREVPDSYPLGSQARTAPAYAADEVPPRYSDRQPEPADSVSSSPREESHLVTSHADSAHQSLTSNSSGATCFAKARHYLEDPVVIYRKRDIVNYLFFDMPAAHLDDELGLLTFGRLSGDFRRFLFLAMLARTRPLQDLDLWPQYRFGLSQLLTPAGERVARLARDFIFELKVSACATSRRILTCMPIVDSREGLLVLLRHMQRARGVQELADFVSDNALWRTALEELRNSDNLHVTTIVKRTQMESRSVMTTLESLLKKIKQLRSDDKSFQITFQFSTATPRMLVSVAGADTIPALSIGDLEDDTYSEVVGVRHHRYVTLLRSAKLVLQATVGAMTDEMFIAARCHLERYIRAGAITVGNDEESSRQLQEVLERVHALSSATEASRINPEYWAAVMTNSSLALAGFKSASRAWVLIPTSDEPPRQLGFVYRPKPLVPLSIHGFHFHRGVIGHMQRLILLLKRTFMHALEARMREFHRHYNMFLVQWEAFQYMPDPSLDASEFESLNRAYKRSLGKLHHLICRIEAASNAATAECKIALTEELCTYMKLYYSFVGRFAACQKSPFTQGLDLKKVQSAMDMYYKEFLRVKAWYVKGNQTPIDPATHKVLAAELDQMITALEADQARREGEAAKA
ncbi:hypothetical protein RBB50_012340 [Rhinocladiella similis]